MNDKEAIQKIITDVLSLLGFDVENAFRELLDEETGDVDLVCALTTAHDSQFLIGHHGANLFALEHMIHTIAHAQGITTRFRIDINDYREGKKKMFFHIADKAAEEAAREKKPVILRPMNGYERRLIHTHLAKNTHVTTESIGEGTERKVVVKPQSVV